MGKTTTFIKWFPVFPFILYWIFSAMVFQFGPFINNSLDISTYFYLMSMFFLFIFSYNIGLKCTRSCRTHKSEFIAPLSILKWTSLFAFMGTLLFVFDRINSGAGSLNLVANEMANLREDFAKNTTWLTTIAVIPQSFRLLAFASYFFCLLKNVKIPKLNHLMIFGIIALDIINMVLSANRGTLFWTMTYLFFYLVFCKRLSLVNLILSKKYLVYNVIIYVAVIMSLSYFYFVASNRTLESTLSFSGRQASSSMRYPSLFEKLDYASIGTVHQLNSYLTHEFEYINVFVKEAELLNFDPIGALGLRVLVQINRFYPEYVPPSKVRGFQWSDSAGLSRYGWPSTFGWPLAMFGLLGAVFFFVALGFFSGKCVGSYLKTMEFGWFALTFLVYASLNMSFDWILKDFDQYICLFFAVILVKIRPRRGRLWFNP